MQKKKEEKSSTNCHIKNSAWQNTVLKTKFGN